MKLKKHHWLILAVVVVALAAVGVLPSYTFVSVQGPDGNIRVQNAGFGGIHVKTDNADIRVNR
jgi:hypothetical protein